LYFNFPIVPSGRSQNAPRFPDSWSGKKRVACPYSVPHRCRSFGSDVRDVPYSERSVPKSICRSRIGESSRRRRELSSRRDDRRVAPIILSPPNLVQAATSRVLPQLPRRAPGPGWNGRGPTYLLRHIQGVPPVTPKGSGTGIPGPDVQVVTPVTPKGSGTGTASARETMAVTPSCQRRDWRSYLRRIQGVPPVTPKGSGTGIPGPDVQVVTPVTPKGSGTGTASARETMVVTFFPETR